MAAYNSSSSSISTTAPAAVSGSMFEGLAEFGSVEDLEGLLMPEYEPSMAPYLRFKLRPKFCVPPPPVMPTSRQQQQQQ